jgi:lipoprotein signal peptidase
MLTQIHARLATRPAMTILVIALFIIGADQLSKQYMLDWIFSRLSALLFCHF